MTAADPTPDLAAAVTRLRELVEVCERHDTGDGYLETSLEDARQMGADLRVVLAAVEDATTRGTESVSADEADQLPPGSIIRFGRSWYPLTMDDGRWRATPADRLGYTLSRDVRAEVLARGVSAENGGESVTARDLRKRDERYRSHLDALREAMRQNGGESS